MRTLQMSEIKMQRKSFLSDFWGGVSFTGAKMAFTEFKGSKELERSHMPTLSFYKAVLSGRHN